MNNGRLKWAKNKTLKHEGYTRGFIQGSEAWYGKNHYSNNQETIKIGFYSEEGESSEEFEISWGIRSGNNPELIAFYDSWSVLSQFSDLIKELALVDGKYISPDEIISILEYLGIKNMTPTERKQTGDWQCELNALIYSELFITNIINRKNYDISDLWWNRNVCTFRSSIYSVKVNRSYLMVLDMGVNTFLDLTNNITLL